MAHQRSSKNGVSTRYRLSRLSGRGFIYLTLAAWGLIAIVPFLWMLSTSVMSFGEAISGKYVTNINLLERFVYKSDELSVPLSVSVPSFVRETDELSKKEQAMTGREYAETRDSYFVIGNTVFRGGLVNYIIAWREADFSEYFINSVMITIITLSGELLFGIMAAYAFARMRFPGKDFIFGLLLSTMMIPGMVTMIPNFLTVTWLGRILPGNWINNWPALTIPFMGSVFAIFLLRQFFAQIPDDLFDAARIDGANHWQFLRRIVLPLSTAPVLTITVLSFIGTWNALAWPLLVTNTPDWRPIAVGLFNFVDDQAGSEIHLQMAGAVITIIPILILYFITQRQFTESIARSGLKG